MPTLLKHWILIFLATGAVSFTEAAQSKTRPTKLMQAVESGNSEALAQLPARTDWNETNAAGETALIKAVALGQTPLVKVLIQKKANLDQRDKAGNTALLYAVSNNDKENALLLIQAGASLDLLYGEKKENILFEVARLGAREIGDEILKRRKALLNQANSEGKTPVFQAIESDQHELALHLIQKGASTQQVTKSGKTLLDIAKENAVEPSSPLFQKLKSLKPTH